MSTICFSNDESLEIVFGHVRKITMVTEYDIYGAYKEYTHDTIDIEKKGNVTKIINVDGAHGLIDKNYYITRYGAHGRKLETDGYYKSSDPENISPYALTASEKSDTGKKFFLACKYNKLNELIGMYFKTNKRLDGINRYKYNLSGDLIESDDYFSPGNLSEVYKYTYDNQHLLIEIDVFDNKNKIENRIKFEYVSFDSEGNWIKRVIHYAFGDRPLFTVTRKITYY